MGMHRSDEGHNEGAKPGQPEILLRRGTQVYRVGGMQQLEDWIAQRRILRADQVSIAGQPWVFVGEIEQLSEAFGSAWDDRNDLVTDDLSGHTTLQPENDHEANFDYLDGIEQVTLAPRLPEVSTDVSPVGEDGEVDESVMSIVNDTDDGALKGFFDFSDDVEEGFDDDEPFVDFSSRPRLGTYGPRVVAALGVILVVAVWRPWSETESSITVTAGEQVTDGSNEGLDPATASTRGNEGLVAAGWVLVEQTQYDEAQGYFETALTSMPMNAAAQLGLAVIAHERGETQEAIRQYCRLVEAELSEEMVAILRSRLSEIPGGCD